MKHQKKFAAQEEQQVSEITSKQSAGLEFASVEELLRFDAKQTEVPPEVARRLQKSTGDLPRPKTTWWMRLLGGLKS